MLQILVIVGHVAAAAAAAAAGAAANLDCKNILLERFDTAADDGRILAVVAFATPGPARVAVIGGNGAVSAFAPGESGAWSDFVVAAPMMTATEQLYSDAAAAAAMNVLPEIQSWLRVSAQRRKNGSFPLPVPSTDCLRHDHG
jgi:hypothetical protein